MLVVEIVGGLVLMRMVLLLLCMMRMMVLMLKFGHLHAKPLVGLPTVQHDMLPLMALVVHGVWIQSGGLTERRGSRRRWCIGVKL